MAPNSPTASEQLALQHEPGDRVVIFQQVDYDAAGSRPEVVPADAQAVENHGVRGFQFTATTQAELDIPAGWHATVIPHATVEAWKTEPPVVVFDVDSTLIEEEVIELLARHAGKEAEVAEVTNRAMRGEIDFAESLHHRVATLEELPVSVIEEVAGLVTVQNGAHELIGAVHALDGKAYAVSGGFNQILSILAKELKLDDYSANQLGVEGEKLTGRVEGAVVDRAAKAVKLAEWAKANDVDPAGVIAVGDGANDIDMLNAAGFGVAFMAKPALREHANLVLDIRNLAAVTLVLNQD